MTFTIFNARRFGLTVGLNRTTANGIRFGVFFGTPMIFDLTHSSRTGWRLYR